MDAYLGFGEPAISKSMMLTDRKKHIILERKLFIAIRGSNWLE